MRYNRVRHVAFRPTERPGGFWNDRKRQYAQHSRPSRTTEHPGGSLSVLKFEFGHLLDIQKLTAHPRGSLEQAEIWVWSLIWGWKTCRTSGRFPESSDIWVWASLCIWKTCRTSEKFYHWYFCHEYHLLYSFFPRFAELRGSICNTVIVHKNRYSLPWETNKND